MDQYKTTTTVGYFSRIGNSIKGIFAGILFISIAFIGLYWNEGLPDMSKVAKSATEIKSDVVSVDQNLNGKLISTTNKVTSDQEIGDNLYLKPGVFVAVERRVEMYAWKEKTESKTEKNVGGSETTNTTYTYTKEWVENPADSSNFKYSESHGNPQKSIESYTNKAMTAKIGVYSFDPQSITLPKLESYSINSENIIPDPKVKLANNQYLYIGIGEQGTLGNPEIGDLRISYHVLKPGFTGTIFGKLNGDNVESYLVKDSSTLYRLFTGTRDESIATLNTEHLFLLWGIRLGGFLFMWVGLIALFAPISVVLDVIPVFGQISLLLTFIVCFVIALILSVVTIFVSMLIHNVIALIIAIFLILGLFVWLFMKIKNKKSLLLNAVSKISPIPPSQPMI